MASMNFVEVTPENAEQEGLFCIKNPKYPGFKLKLDWLEKRRKEGLKLMLLKKEGKTAAFIEYVPGAYAWRPVLAQDYLFIHCLWVYPKSNLGLGYGSMLIDRVEQEAKESGMAGVVTVASKGTWMPSPEVYKKNGFTEVETKDRFNLLVKKSGNGADPSFTDWEQNLSRYQGLNLVYANQCPLFIKSVDEMKKTAEDHGLELKVKVLDSPEQIREAASGYGVYSLIYDGRLLADHYISNTRFKNILIKEVLNK